jgi:cytoskeleton protein RodZ
VHTAGMGRRRPEGWDAAAFELGRVMASARERAGLTVEEVGRLAGIPARFIFIIDEGRLDMIGEATHARGYLRTYAAAVGLDADAVTLAFCRLRTRARFLDMELTKLARP